MYQDLWSVRPNNTCGGRRLFFVSFFSLRTYSRNFNFLPPACIRLSSIPCHAQGKTPLAREIFVMNPQRPATSSYEFSELDANIKQQSESLFKFQYMFETYTS